MLFKIQRGLFKLLKCFKTMQCWSVLVFVGKFDAALGTHLLALSAAAGREEEKLSRLQRPGTLSRVARYPLTVNNILT